MSLKIVKYFSLFIKIHFYKLEDIRNKNKIVIVRALIKNYKVLMKKLINIYRIYILTSKLQHLSIKT